MACSTVRYSLLRNPAVRHYAAAAAQAKACPSASLPTPEVQKMGNDVTLAVVDNNSPVSHVSIAFKAGPRNETYDIQGISHALRITAGLCGERASYFGITRNIQQLGGNLIITGDRESISYNLQIARNNIESALFFLEDVATRQILRPWEVSDQNPRLRYEVSTIPDTSRVIELLHKAAYRRGLGYSLYCPKRNVGRLGSETLKHFINKNYSGNRCVVASAGVPECVITQFAENLQLPGNAESCDSIEPTKYCGGDIRKDRTSELATVAVAVEGAGWNKEKDALAFAVLQCAAGTGPKVKWGSTASSLASAVSCVAEDGLFAISALNMSYSDSGLFGFILSASAENAGPLTRCAAKWMKNPGLTPEDICRGKNELKATVLYGTESNQGLVDHLVQQGMLKGKICPVSALVAEIDKITSTDVMKVAKKMATGKLSMAAIGNLETVPCVDEL